MASDKGPSLFRLRGQSLESRVPLQVLRGEACHSDYVGPGALPLLCKTGCSLAELHSHTVERAFQCCILLCVCLFLFLCVVVVAIVLSVTVFLCVVVVASLSGGFCGSKAFESCCKGFGAFKGCPKRATWQFRSPITHSHSHSLTCACTYIHSHKLTHHHPSITLILPLPFLLFYAQSKSREVGNMWGYPVL